MLVEYLKEDEVALEVRCVDYLVQEDEELGWWQGGKT